VEFSPEPVRRLRFSRRTGCASDLYAFDPAGSRSLLSMFDIDSSAAELSVGISGSGVPMALGPGITQIRRRGCSF